MVEGKATSNPISVIIGEKTLPPPPSKEEIHAFHIADMAAAVAAEQRGWEMFIKNELLPASPQGQAWNLSLNSETNTWELQPTKVEFSHRFKKILLHIATRLVGPKEIILKQLKPQQPPDSCFVLAHNKQADLLSGKPVVAYHKDLAVSRLLVWLDPSSPEYESEKKLLIDKGKDLKDRFDVTYKGEVFSVFVLQDPNQAGLFSKK